MIYPDPCYIQFCTGGGLCNRLRAWYGIGAAADMKAVPFYTHWCATDDCEASFEQLFKPYRCEPLESTNMLRVHYPESKRYIGTSRVHGANMTTMFYAERHRDHHPGSIFRKWVADRCNGLELHDDLQQRVDRFINQLPMERVVGVHVRRTDLPRTHDIDHRLFAYLDAEIQQSPDVLFMVCVDNGDSLVELRERYDNRIVWRRQMMSETHGKRHTSMEDAVVDLYSLARASRIIGTRGSSFSQVAGAIAGVSPHYI